MEKKVKGLYLIDGKCYAKPNFMVSGLIPTEEADVSIIGKKGKDFICKVDKITKPSPNRTNPVCSYINCGGCSYKHIDYQAQLLYKQQYIISLFKEFRVKVNNCIGMDKPLASRYKTIASFGLNKNKVIAGIYEEGSHNIINIENCPIQNIDANKIIKELKIIMADLKLMPYDEDRKTGLIRHVYIRTSYYLKDIMVVIVTASELFPNRSIFVKKLLEVNPNIKTIVQNINSRNTSIVMGDKERILYGNGSIKDKISNLTFNISSKSFFQVNPKQTEVLYNKAIQMANLSKNDVVLDAYCGIGTISLLIANKVKKVIGVEIVKEAIKNAIDNAKSNNIKNAYFVADDVSKYIVSMAKNHEFIDCLIMDPPRKGSDSTFLQAVLALQPKRIVYISCGPETQKRDILELSRKYEIKSIQPVDMFCYTHHVENVCVLERK